MWHSSKGTKCYVYILARQGWPVEMACLCEVGLEEFLHNFVLDIVPLPTSVGNEAVRVEAVPSQTIDGEVQPLVLEGFLQQQRPSHQLCPCPDLGDFQHAME